MSNPGNPQNPYGQPTQQGAPAGYPAQQAQQRPPLDKAVLRQVVFGGVVVVGIAVITTILSIIGSAVYAFRGELILSLFWSIFVAVVFVVGAGVSALYIAPFAKATSTVDLVKKLAIAAAIGAAALLVLNFIWSVITGGQYLVQMIISSGILGSISSGLTYGAFFALGVFIARALPARPQASVGQPQGYAAPQGHAPAPQQGYQNQQGQAPGYVQPQAPQVPQAPVPPQQ